MFYISIYFLVKFYINEMFSSVMDSGTFKIRIRFLVQDSVVMF